MIEEEQQGHGRRCDEQQDGRAVRRFEVFHRGSVVRGEGSSHGVSWECASRCEDRHRTSRMVPERYYLCNFRMCTASSTGAPVLCRGPGLVHRSRAGAGGCPPPVVAIREPVLESRELSGRMSPCRQSPAGSAWSNRSEPTRGDVHEWWRLRRFPGRVRQQRVRDAPARPDSRPSTFPRGHASRERPPALPAPRGPADVVPDVLTEVEVRCRSAPPGRPMPQFPEPRPVSGTDPGPRGLDVQPEGWRRQDHDDDQPRCVAGGVRPQGAAGRLRPAGLAVGGPGPQPARDGPHHLQPADAARRRPRRRRRPLRRARAWTCCRPTSTCRPPRCSWSTRWPASRRCSGCWPRRIDAVRRHPHRLPALARPADGQRPHRLRRRHRAAGVRVLRAARRGAAQDHHRQGPRAAQPRAWRSTACSAPCSTAARCTAARSWSAWSQAWGDTVFHTVIRRTVKFSDSTVAGEPITSYASTSAGAESYRQLAKEVLARWPDE